MNKLYDWIVIGGGITGAALSYELAKVGFSVLLLEQNSILSGATRFGYGGISYWTGTSELTRQLSIEGIERHRQLPQELDADIEFRELDLLLTIDADRNPAEILAQYANCYIAPKLLSTQDACELEPLLNPDAIAGAIQFRHAHIKPPLLVSAYLNALVQLGGEIVCETVVKLDRVGHKIVGVTTQQQAYRSANTVVCAGGLSRSLLKASGISSRIYFTHAELIETEPTDLELRTMVMPADTKRCQLEADASKATIDPLWDEVGHELLPSSVDVGAIQFRDRTMKLGQLSRVLTDPNVLPDATQSENEIRAKARQVLPKLADLKGTWYHCLVAFSHDGLPLVGALPDLEQIYLFSGFTSPLVYVPPLALRFAREFTQSSAFASNAIVSQLSPQRFGI
ncbi:FAD-dependent oxidoreductase [Tumidithrix elongata RA019]|uniref:FAD-dependent oxidoreductase n=1 Tax=Tumidithrix elongata BACA0141 TaxID=2716417 RepID=A0AAW9PZB0_9CYAN|nr:FAD-dependent oxidoreductase [Tumidithrix elongata RA019]